MANNQEVHTGNHRGKPIKNVAAGAVIDNAEVAEPNGAYKQMASNWALVMTVLGGTEAMRAARKTYLPQHAYEDDDAYKERLAQTVLDNETLRTLNTLVGKAFKVPPVLAETVPEALTDLQENIDMEGTALAPFARNWFRHGVRDALAHVLIDSPVLPEREDGLARTKADDEKDGARPFWRMIPATEMLGMRWARVGGVMQLSQIRFQDNMLMPSGAFGEVLVERVKVINTDTWEIWEKKVEGAGKSRWEKVESGVNALGKVPLVTFYTNKDAPGVGRSPLMDLAHINVRHWQSSSDQNNILTIARFPMLGGSGISGSEAESVVVGPRQFLSVKDAQGKIYYIEHGGRAIEAGAADLANLEKKMASYGAEFLDKAGGPDTATGRILDEGEAISPLQAWGLDFKDAMEQALQLTAEWLNIEAGDDLQVEFSVEAETDLTNQPELSTIAKDRARRDISRKFYLEEMKRRGVYPEEFDIDADEEELESEAPDGEGVDGALGDMFSKPGDKKPADKDKKKPEDKKTPKGPGKEATPPAKE